ncbi:helix-turn-helix domain-containing protein [Listeria ilorinensis]|uniref:helix-turn-helix domain-containing protein n=1 Tax=Listeria ilorinensis TaxID=2867439 RepID=UPI001EF67F96|nr:helix-turn-helix transcriptional regulator [Listeria ilorinensis]
MSKIVTVRVNELLKKHDMSLTKLAVLTGIEPARLSEFANNKRQRVQLDYISRIAETLNIADIREIMTIEDR